MDTSKVIIAVVILLLLGGGAYFYFQNKEGQMMGDRDADDQVMTQSESPSSLPDAMMEGDQPTASDDAMEAGVKEFTVNGSNFKFEPAVMTVNKGDKVKITFKNDGGFHDFTLDEFGVQTKQIAAGASETVEFTADKVGDFEYYCSVGNHRSMGMKGTLTVK